jgi:hypothetical protein
MLDCFECIWDIRATYSAVDRGSWGHYVLDMLETAPAMNQMFDERLKQDWYPALEDLMKAKESGRLDAPSVRGIRWWRAAVARAAARASSMRGVRWVRRMWKATTPQEMSQHDTEQQP